MCYFLLVKFYCLFFFFTGVYFSFKEELRILVSVWGKVLYFVCFLRGVGYSYSLFIRVERSYFRRGFFTGFRE